ncbi:phage integrase family protein [Asaia bogorensis NBRC 16594]|uniref:Tyr recombinase domain-containing protein n=2 Tax=Asaia bogorensis TaxID=91915 RepID=A0AAN4R773_9PROT|nr:phage integrase family protein [Asaia bogorensis NBRC 16594]GEL54796.1 hypothetical protein ABO01nite_28030 [Asaia bogorensis NBRC 16594]
MIHEGLSSFAQLDPPAVKRLASWLQMRPGKAAGDPIKADTVGSYLGIIANMYRQRDKLDDSPLVEPFPGETPFEAAGLVRGPKERIPFIPDAIAVDLLSKALLWVEEYSFGILEAFELWSTTDASLRAQERSSSTRTRIIADTMRRAAITGPDGHHLVGGRITRSAAYRLADACFVVIAGFVGMRVSEILSMQVGTIEHHPIGETGVSQAYIVARVFKMSAEPQGRIERWLAPPPVVTAVACLERLHAPLRAVSGYTDLFLGMRKGRGEAVRLINFVIVERLNKFAAQVGVPLHENAQWRITPHQFRKTFARFVARGDRSHLLALAAHFKHVSVAMTSRGYVGNDFALHELVDHEGRIETALALDHLLASDRLGGHMGERITARNHAFRGRAGEQVRRDYIDFVLAETDLRIRGCDYGWCVFQSEVALCDGSVAPNEARRGSSVCVKCSNFAVDKRHVLYWEDRRRRNETLLDRVTSPLVRATLNEVIEECDSVLTRIGGEGQN